MISSNGPRVPLCAYKFAKSNQCKTMSGLRWYINILYAHMQFSTLYQFIRVTFYTLACGVQQEWKIPHVIHTVGSPKLCLSNPYARIKNVYIILYYIIWATFRLIRLNNTVVSNWCTMRREIGDYIFSPRIYSTTHGRFVPILCSDPCVYFSTFLTHFVPTRTPVHMYVYITLYSIYR